MSWLNLLPRKKRRRSHDRILATTSDFLDSLLNRGGVAQIKTIKKEIRQMDKQEKEVTAFVKGKTIEEIKEAIRKLAEEAWHSPFAHIQDALGVESGDNACYHLSGYGADEAKRIHLAWLEYYASREIVDFIEEYKEIENALEIREAIGGAFPRPTE